MTTAKREHVSHVHKSAGILLYPRFRIYSISGLTGRPDYLVEENGALIPVEVKSGRAPSIPYDSHVFQLAAYCLLVEETFGKRPPYGLLHYGGKEPRTFAIDFTPELENTVRGLIQEIQGISMRKGVDRSHENPARCARCGYRNVARCRHDQGENL